MLSDSTGYGGSSDSSMYSTCPFYLREANQKMMSPSQKSKILKYQLSGFSAGGQQYPRNREGRFGSGYASNIFSSHRALPPEPTFSKPGDPETVDNANPPKYLVPLCEASVYYEGRQNNLEDCYMQDGSSGMNLAPCSSPVSSRSGSPTISRENSDVLYSDNSFEHSFAKTDRSEAEYHTGTSVRLHTMPTACRANCKIAARPSQLKSRIIAFQQDNNNIKPASAQFGIPKTKSLDERKTKLFIQQARLHLPPEKPPRGRLVTRQFTEVANVKRATPRLIKSISLREVYTKSPKNEHDKSTSQFETDVSVGNRFLAINIQPEELQIHSDLSYNTVTLEDSNLLLNEQWMSSSVSDPNQALFENNEHIYESIDTDPSMASSDDEQGNNAKIQHSLRSHFANSSGCEDNNKPLQLDFDLRPKVPEKPFYWPFVIFPPDKTFQPRSLHAYHRRQVFESGRLPLNEDATEIESSPEKVTIVTVKNSDAGAPKRSVKLARIPSVFSKVST